MPHNTLPLAISLGEPGGIGPDVALKAWANRKRTHSLPFVVVGDAGVLASRSDMLACNTPIKTVTDIEEAASVFEAALPVLHQDLNAPCVPGKADQAHASNVIRAIDTAVGLALSGRASGVVTCPIQKESLYAAGFSHQGHTDYIADLARTQGHDATPVMMLVANDLRTVPLTVHIPLKDVPGAITRTSILSTVKVIADDLRTKFCIDNPRIGITGLNPHAGENATLGTEERDIIEPAINELERTGLNVTGPLPADTVFHEEARQAYDAILCMYHDQALIPVKTIGFHDGVNTTLGLPFIRTSPDHGTALSLAGTGKANPSSMISAISLAGKMAANFHV